MGIFTDWKLKLRYGKYKTPFKHFTVIVPVQINEHIVNFDAAPGTAYAGFKIWATDVDEAAALIRHLADDTGFSIIGNIAIYDTAPKQPPGNLPNIYDANFSYYIP